MLVGFLENWGISGKKGLRESLRQPGKISDDSFRKDCALIRFSEIEQIIACLNSY